MIKRTFCFSNPAYLSTKDEQLVIRNPESDVIKTRPIEDVAVIILEHPRITITHNLIRKLNSHNIALISCNDQHMPAAMMLPLEGNYTQTAIQRNQIDASQALKKQLWQQTVVAKVLNQAKVLEILGKPAQKLHVLAKRVNSGDTKNIEGQAAAYYWGVYLNDFIRDRYGDPPNHLLNYGYSILRSMVARALISSGLIPTLGIWHKNKYNPYGLADDIMEPYRPFIDLIAHYQYKEEGIAFILSTESKTKLLQVATVDALFGKHHSPLMVGMSRTTASLAACFEGKKKRIVYPKFPDKS